MTKNPWIEFFKIKETGIECKPKFKLGQRIYYMSNREVVSDRITQIVNYWCVEESAYSYQLKDSKQLNNDESANFDEETIFATLKDLYKDLGQNIKINGVL